MKTKLMMMAAAVAVAFGAWAYEETIGGYTWTYRINGDTAEIYKGTFSAAIVPKPTGAVTIPATLGGKPVTSIGDYAFYNCSGLTSVTIPDGVTSIGESAFSYCSGLLSFSVAADNPSYKSVSGLLLTKDGKTLVAGINGDVTIPDSVTSIGSYAFYGCSGLTSVTIPDSVTSMGSFAFGRCNDLLFDTTTIPGVYLVDGWAIDKTGTLSGHLDLTGVRGIAGHAFSGCSGLTSVTIPDSVTSIGDFAFSYCSGLTSVTIPDGVTSIGDWAFHDCSGLTSVTIPNSVTNIGDEAFWCCSGLTSVTIGNGVTSIGVKAFWDCSGLTSVTIPDSVTSIGHWAFAGCSGLTSVTIPDSVTSIGDFAFSYCSGLTSVTIGNGVTSIGYRAFEDCSGLTSVTIPDSVKVIGRCVFLSCDALTSVVVPSWCKNAKYDDEYNIVAGAGLSLRTDEFRSELLGCTCSGHDCDAPARCLRAVSHIKITYKDVWGGDQGDGIESDIWKTARTLQGALVDNYSGDIKGVVQVKVGKADKNGEVAVSGTIMGLDGKKLTAKGSKVGVRGETATATLAVKGGTTVTVTIGKDGISGLWNGAEIRAAVVGGNWTRGGAKVYVDGALGDRALPEGTVAELLPDGVPVIAAGGKWKFAKVASEKWAKPKKGAARPERYDAESGKGLVVDTSKGDNLSAMKLSYTPKKGTFKGTFKVYALEGAGKATKLKKYTVKVSGVVVDGVGYGTATCKKPVISWSVTVE